MKLRGKLPGLSYQPKLRICNLLQVVEEHSIVGRSQSVSTGGRDRRENAGISSESRVRIPAVESLRFPGEGSSAQG